MLGGGGGVYDSKPLKACSYGSACRFIHKIQNAPVTAVEKAELMSLENRLGPEKKAALLIVMAKPTFLK